MAVSVVGGDFCINYVIKWGEMGRKKGLRGYGKWVKGGDFGLAGNGWGMDFEGNTGAKGSRIRPLLRYSGLNRWPCCRHFYTLYIE